MHRVAVLTDSSSDLDPAQAEALGLYLLLLTVHFDGKDWLDHLELSSEEMFASLQTGMSAPYLQVPTVEYYLQTVEGLLATHDEVFALHTSPLIGKVYNLAFQASQALSGRLTVYNSRTTSGGLALQAMRARALFDQGLSTFQVAEALRLVQQQQCTRICVTTLDGFRREKIIGRVRAMLGTMQNIKPILGEQAGRLKVLKNERGAEAALTQMQQMVQEYAEGKQGLHVVFGHSGDGAGVEMLRQKAQELGIEEKLDLHFGAVLSSVAGPNAYGFCLEPKQLESSP